jgi:predicted AAA+ superfamily ATPase
LNYWRSTAGHEVDFIFGSTAVEVKSTSHVHEGHLGGLKALQEEKMFKRYILVSTDMVAKSSHGISFLYWEDFLKKLWAGDFQ